MDAATLTFRQRNGLTKLALTLRPDYVEFSISGNRKTGFNVKYHALPNEFD